MSKGLIRCSSCGGTIAVASARSGKSKALTLQCCNYAKGLCSTSHSVVVPKIEKAIMDGLHQALGNKQFTISPERVKPAETKVDYDKLIAIEERKMERARSAFLAEVDTIEQYAANKKEIEKRIAELVEMKGRECVQDSFDSDVFAQKVRGIVEFIEDAETSLEAKNEALRTIVDKIVYTKPTENIDIYFFD